MIFLLYMDEINTDRLFFAKKEELLLIYREIN